MARAIEWSSKETVNRPTIDAYLTEFLVTLGPYIERTPEMMPESLADGRIYPWDLLVEMGFMYRYTTGEKTYRGLTKLAFRMLGKEDAYVHPTD